jgi:uncharacterized integral membrane protein
MLRFIRYLILAVIVGLLVVVSMANRDIVTLETLTPELADLTGLGRAIQLPLYVVALGGVAVGLLLGFLIEWIRESKHRSEVAKRQRQVRQLNSEVNRLRGQTNNGKDDVLALLEKAPRKSAV